MSAHTRQRRALRPTITVTHSGTIVLTLLMLLVSVTAPVRSVGAATLFTDPQGRFSVMLPDGWQQDTVTPTAGFVIQYLTMAPNGAFNVVATPLPDGVTLDDITPRVSARLQQQYRDYQQTNTDTINLAGEPGARLDYTATPSSGKLLAVSQLLVPHNGTLYIVTLAAEPQDIDAILQASTPILQSWQWLP